nr:MAG TPA: hypothetical protein [Caudoviricetes sp.]
MVYISNTTVVLPLTPLTYLWRKTKDLYLCCFASFIICFTKLLQL